MKITRKGIPTAVKGTQPVVGDKAPVFTLEDMNGDLVSLTDFAGKKVILSVFPDINTKVCDMQTVHFYKLASKLKDTQIINISNNDSEDLLSWCAMKDIDALMLHDDGSFAKAYGLWIPEFEVLARSVFIIDEQGTIIYEEIVEEMVHEPNYDAAVSALA